MKLSIFDILVVGALWYWYFASSWPAGGLMALCVTAWIGGGLLVAGGTPTVRAVGGITQFAGGILGCGATLYLLWSIFRWLGAG